MTASAGAPSPQPPLPPFQQPPPPHAHTHATAPGAAAALGFTLLPSPTSPHVWRVSAGQYPCRRIVGQAIGKVHESHGEPEGEDGGDDLVCGGCGGVGDGDDLVCGGCGGVGG